MKCSGYIKINNFKFRTKLETRLNRNRYVDKYGDIYLIKLWTETKSKFSSLLEI